MVDSANHDRDSGDGVKVGGHQASSASLVSAMTALYFAHLDAPGPGQRQAARVAGLPRDPVPARQPRPVLPHAAAPARRPAVLPVAHQGPRPGRLLHRVGGARRGGAAVRRGHAALRRRPLRRAARGALLRADRRRRARRGQHLGGHRRPRDRGPRQRHLDRRLQPAEPRPRRARRPDPAVARAVRRGRLARRRGQVRPPAHRGVRPAGRRRAARLDRRDAQRAVPGAASASLARSCASGSSTVPRRPRSRSSRESPTTSSGRWCATSAATTSVRCSRPTRRATRSPTGRAWCSPTPSRAGACRSRATRATTRRC